MTKRIVTGAVLAVLVTGLVLGLTRQTEALTIWSSSTTPAVASDSDAKAIELGMKFRSSIATTVTGVKFYKGSTNTGTHTGSLWSATGTRLAQVTFTGETATGWQTAKFASPVSINANTTYVISYFAPRGHYAVDSGYFASKSVTNGTLTALKNGTDGSNGVYRYASAGGFPNASYNSSNYWVDVITADSADTTAPTVSLTAPASGATISGTTTITASATDNVAVASVQFLVDGAASGGAVTASPYSLSLDTTKLTNGSHSLSAVATDTAGNKTTSGTVQVTVSNQSTTTPPPTTSTSSLWAPSVAPTTGAANDTSAVEVGTKFRSSVATTVTGIEFYKGSTNTGTHTGSLWSANGTKLASVTFTGESASGWQAATFASPVSIAANTTYVVSYFAPNGNYAVDSGYFASASYTNGTLSALKDGLDGGNGVYSYGAISAFPSNSYNSSNYWVDVITSQSASTTPPPSDTTPPTVTAVSPVNGSTNVAIDTMPTATFSEGLLASTVSNSTVQLKDAQGAVVPSAIAYDASRMQISVTPTNQLQPSTTYSLTITTGVKDAAGNALASASTSLFTTKAPAAMTVGSLGQGFDGPVLIVTQSGKPFGQYYAEILRAEGINSFKTVDIASLNSTMLSQYDVTLLAEMSLTDTQVTMLSDWVNAGGNLVAMRPDKKLAGLLGLTDQSAVQAEGYVKVDTSKAPGAGITDQTIQYHGVADKYTVTSGTSAVANLYATDTAATTSPAVSLRSVGANGGNAAAFTYDLAKSVVYTHQGNPAWSGDDRDGNGVIRPNDLFYGNKTGDVQPDYVNLNKVAIPQADEQQRLLTNLIGEMNKTKRPIPKLAYFPYNKKAVVVMAADDHATANGTQSALDYQLSQSPAGCSVADWQCVRSTSLMYTSTPITNAQALNYYNQGFDFGVHTSTGCANWTMSSLPSAIDSDMNDFKQKYVSLPAQHVNRIHCIAWSDYATAAKVEAQKNLRIDLNYYYWPGSWVQNRPGFMTGSGMSMRFADTDGTMIDTYQLPSHLVNESGQTFPQNIDTMLAKALGPEGYYGVLGTHYDYSDSFDRQLVQSALAKNVPLVSGQQYLDWEDGRNNSYVSGSSWSGSTFNFTASIDSRMRQMGRMLVPYSTKNGTITGITKDGVTVTYTLETMKGVNYAVIPVTSGSYAVSYAVDTTPPVVVSQTPANTSTGNSVTGSVSIAFNEPLDASTVTTATVQLLNGMTVVPASVSYSAATNSVTLTPTSYLSGLTTYTVQVTTGLKDSSGNALANAYMGSFTTGDAVVSIWAPNQQSVSTANDSDVEVGLKFQSSQNGKISRLLFYKSANDTSTSHTLTLWSSTGTSLATATTSNETTSGWQTAQLATPIAVTAGTQYVVSYRAQNGQYTYTTGGLGTAVTKGSLTAVANGGVFRYGGGFPDQSYNSSNYWLDIGFGQ